MSAAPLVADHFAASAVTRPTQRRCDHCGLSISGRSVGAGPYFCCTGCAIVYATLKDAGYDETFYRLRDVAGLRQPARVTASGDDLLLAELDARSFLERHTRTHDDGTRSASLFVDGVHCAACVWLVERLPYALEGIAEARLDLPRSLLHIRWRPEHVALSAVGRWLGRVGYDVKPVDAAARSLRTGAERRLLTKMGVTWALAANVMLLAAAMYAGLDLDDESGLVGLTRWLSLTLSVPAVAYGGSEFFRRAWASLVYCFREGTLSGLHMDTPISIGILTGFGHSAVATLTGAGEIWFDSITILIAALLTARWLQLRSRRLAGDASDRLMALIPTMVRRVTADEGTETVEACALEQGDVVEVAAGEIIPADGCIVAGRSHVNNAILSGESKPVSVWPGIDVHAGSTNVSGTVRISVAALGDETRIGSLLNWVRNAGEHRAPVVMMADRVIGYFVPIVLGLALVTALIWWRVAPEDAVRNVVALLVVTCPCALGMATPLAMAVAAGRAAREGIFIKSDQATQVLTELDTVVLDKTGTVTEGTLDSVAYSGDLGAIRLAVALERQSKHPIAHALVAAFGHPHDAQTAVANFEAVPGKGVRGEVEGRLIAVGSPPWIGAIAGDVAPEQAAGIAQFVSEGLTPVYISVDGIVETVLGFGDRIRPDAARTVAALHERGLDVYLLSGDHPDVVTSIGAALQIRADHAFGGCSPEDKKAFICRLQKEKRRRVAMVGDGVNDAAAMRQADVGIAVGGTNSVSKVAADILMTQRGVEPLEMLVDGAHRTMRAVKHNLWFSLAYNVVGAAAAIAGLVSPLVAAIAMPVSSLVVVTSSILQPGIGRLRPDDVPNGTRVRAKHIGETT